MSSEREDAAGPPGVGAEVWSADEHRLGRVDEVLGDYFLLNDGDGGRYWLPRQTLRTAGGGERVEVSFPKGDLRLQVMTPPDRTDDSQYLGRESLSGEESYQREVMLRQLAGQREQMHEEGSARPEADRTVGEPVEEELAHRTEDDESEPRRD